MSTKKFILSCISLAVVIVTINSQALQFLFTPLKEPKEIILHIFVTLGLYVFLSRRFSLLTAFIGALLFGIFPGHAQLWVLGTGYWTVLAMELGLLIGVSWCALFFERFYVFLKTQEKVVRYLFMVGVYALVLGFGLMDAQINTAFKDDVSLWGFRIAHAPSVRSYNAWAGLLYSKLKKTDEAVVVYQKTLKLDPRNKHAYFALGQIYRDTGQPELMIGIYNELLKNYPEDDAVYVRVMGSYSKAAQKYPQNVIYQEKREELLGQYEQLSKRKKYTAADYYNLGFLYDQVGGGEEAMRFYRKALELDPRHEKALYGLANRFQQTGDVKTALALYGRLIKLHPKSTLGYLNMGVIYNALGDADKAKYLYQKVISIDPANADAYFNLGYLNENAGDLKEALNDYEKAVENNPRQAEAYYNMGNVYAGLQQYPEAIASYLKTVGIDPKHQNAFVNLSILSFKSNDFQGAIHYLEQARVLGYNPPDAYLKTLEPYKSKK